MTRPRYDKHGRRQYTAAERRLRRRLRAHGKPCALCGGEIDYTLPQYDPNSFEIDHIIPVARGGLHTWDNIQPAHRKCNRAKSDGLTMPATAAPAAADAAGDDEQCPTGKVCWKCNGTHSPQSGVSFVTARQW